MERRANDCNGRIYNILTVTALAENAMIALVKKHQVVIARKGFVPDSD